MPSRRTLLSIFAATAALPLLGRRGMAQTVPLTPECRGEGKPTIAQTEGPFFTPNTPLKRDFAADVPGGEKMLLAGHVLDTGCRPVAGALIELWHADPAGHYDNQGYRLRGHQFADAEGRWSFATIVPALYPGRTRHYHVKVQRQGGRVLTTQLYFPDETGNRRDGLFREELLMRVVRQEGGRAGRFDFVI